VQGTDEFVKTKKAAAAQYMQVSTQHRGASTVLAKLSQALPAKMRARMEGEAAQDELRIAWDKVLNEKDGDTQAALRKMCLDLVDGVGQELFAEAGAQMKLSDERTGQAREAAMTAKQLQTMIEQAAESEEKPPGADAGGAEGKADADGGAGK